ncbi:hypothetical protein OGATHE_000719 [Ogataea polymorpha]|uniref:Uncharacterized protein n=1 Tax=Ogataea polymorpha TaxID=460523 RepID=A0A9P8TGM4_9ASCO|nr:hypothetical protein OGATHE_000719 [Ogataea polymorpha]
MVFRALMNSPPLAPSTVLWSNVPVMLITSSNAKPCGLALSGTAFFSTVPMARIADCGGLRIDVNSVTAGFIPRLEIVMVPPWNSSGDSLFSLALLPRSLTSLEMVSRPLACAFLTIGVINPVGVATATETSTFENCLMIPSFSM